MLPSLFVAESRVASGNFLIHSPLAERGNTCSTVECRRGAFGNDVGQWRLSSKKTKALRRVSSVIGESSALRARSLMRGEKCRAPKSDEPGYRKRKGSRRCDTCSTARA